MAVVRRRVLRLLEKRGALPAEGPEDAKQAYPLHSLQQRLRFSEVDVRPPPKEVPRCAFLDGFSSPVMGRRGEHGLAQQGSTGQGC